ncbi:MAG TPA: hypothetical protein VGI81_19735, partial [Tepidisphaeraceae bacterium]
SRRAERSIGLLPTPTIPAGADIDVFPLSQTGSDPFAQHVHSRTTFVRVGSSLPGGHRQII